MISQGATFNAGRRLSDGCITPLPVSLPTGEWEILSVLRELDRSLVVVGQFSLHHLSINLLLLWKDRYSLSPYLPRGLTALALYRRRSSQGILHPSDDESHFHWGRTESGLFEIDRWDRQPIASPDLSRRERKRLSPL